MNVVKYGHVFAVEVAGCHEIPYDLKEPPQAA
jgi:hypothetical protein